MKKLLLILFVLLISFSSIKSQELDLGNMKITYSLNYISDTLNMKNVSNDIMILLVGKKISVFYSYRQFVADSLFMADKAKGVSPAEMMANMKKYRGSKNSYTIFKNYPNNKITTFDKIALDHFQYEEPLESPVWKITNEKTKILTYSCQKATAFFLSRYYEAWFSTEIPIISGPWKFNGLPGLILRVNDIRNHYVFECVGLETLKPGNPIILPNGSCIKVSKPEFQKTYRRCMDDFSGYLESTTGIKCVDGGSDNPRRPYNPIEL